MGSVCRIRASIVISSYLLSLSPGAFSDKETDRVKSGGGLKEHSDYVHFNHIENGFPLVFRGDASGIYYDHSDHEVVKIAARLLGEDLERVSGVKPDVLTADSIAENSVIVGTIGRNKVIQELAVSGKLDLSDIQGQWEAGLIQVVKDPVPGVKQCLVIVGSDRRGAAFGVFDLSQRIGVSPWYWWADIPVQKHKEIFIKGRYLQSSPSVKYRGIFINDEDWGMHLWAKNTFSPEDGGIGPKVYEKIFELLLRLKANHVWPAMHVCTKAFNAFPENSRLADDYAIVMGSSHCEPLLRNNVWEWYNWYTDDGLNRGPWDWSRNSENMTAYWRDRVKVNSSYENIYTVGLRAIHDEPMESGEAVSSVDKMHILQDQVLPAQRKLIQQYVNKDETVVPQILCPYKEVLELYEAGMKVPDDVTLLWPDDNYGFLRRLSSPEEQLRSGRSGVYYHISYFTGPWLWLCTTPPSLVWEEMNKAYEYGADRVWVLNVGDLKPAELVTDFFLQMAWDIDRWGASDVHMFAEHWFLQNFPEEFASEISEIMMEYYCLGQSRKPEHMTWFWDYDITPDQEPEFSPFHFGDEIEKRIEEYYQIKDRADEVYNQLPDRYKDAFFQLVLYPVRASAFFNKKALYARKSRIYAELGRTSANWYAAQAKTAFELIRLETEQYNKVVAAGKWCDMMQDNPRQAPNFGPPDVSLVARNKGADMGVMAEGQTMEMIDGGEAFLPEFLSLTPKSHFIDIFNKAADEFAWSASVSMPWIKLSRDEGRVELKDERVWVSIDWENVPEGGSTGVVNINGAGRQRTIVVKVNKMAKPDFACATGYVEANGYISMEAEHFSRKHDADDVRWVELKGLGRTGSSIILQPANAKSRTLCTLKETAPSLEYDVHLNESGEVAVRVICLPTHAANPGQGLRYAIAFDEAEPQIVEYDTKEFSHEWIINVLRSAALTESLHTIDSGMHTLKIWMVDPAVVLDKVVIYRGGLPESYLGPDETRL